MLMSIKTEKNSKETYEVVIPLWQIKLLCPVSGHNDLYKFKIDDTWTWYYIDKQTALEITDYINNKEAADRI